jgi:osmotically inducible protein OsmC
MERMAKAQWEGTIREGGGSLALGSGAFEGPYSFKSRFGSGTSDATNPEELIGAAHAGCFTMALSAQLGNAGLTPETLETKATVTLDKQDAGWAVTHILLDVKGRVPKADQAAWDKATQAAKTGCPISKLLNANIEMQAKLE